MAFVPDNRRYLTQRLPDAGVKRLQRVVAVKSRTINSNVRRSGKMRARREESAMLKTSSRSVRATDRSAGQYRLLLSRRLSIHDGQDQCGGGFKILNLQVVRNWIQELADAAFDDLVKSAPHLKSRRTLPWPPQREQSRQCSHPARSRLGRHIPRQSQRSGRECCA